MLSATFSFYTALHPARVALEYSAPVRDSTAMYHCVRRPTRDEICPTAPRPQKFILSMPVLREKLGVLLASSSAGWLLAALQPSPLARGSHTSAATPAQASMCWGLRRHGGFCAHPRLSVQHFYSFLHREISLLFFMTSKNGVSLHLPKQLQRAAAGVEQQGEVSCRDTLSRWGKKAVPQGQAFGGIH